MAVAGPAEYESELTSMKGLEAFDWLVMIALAALLISKPVGKWLKARKAKNKGKE